MKKISLFTSASALAVLLGAPAFAQSEFATGANITGVRAIEDRLDDVEEAVEDDFDRSNDAARFGPADRRTGTFGSLALTYAGRDGTSENQDFNLAGRVSHNVGNFQQSVGILLEYSEDNQGDAETQETSVIYDGSYYFNDRFYAFALGRLTTDGVDLDDLDDEDFLDRDGTMRRDAFFGVGPGYRIINNPDTAWRVQAGVGIRYAKEVETDIVGAAPGVPGVRVSDTNSDTGEAYIISSRFYHRFNDQFFLTNDTDFLSSDANDTATNELGLNFSMTESFSTRVSYTTEYVSTRETRTDNTLGVSLVYGF